MARPEITEFKKEESGVSRRDLNLKLTWGKLFLLVSLALALSSFGPLSLFAPVPLILGTLLYGRAKLGLGVSLGVGALFIVAQFYAAIPMLIIFFVMSYMLSQAIAGIFYNQISPVKGLMYIGFGLTILISIGVLSAISYSDVSVTALVTDYVQKSLATIKESQGDLLAQGGDEARVLKDYIENPKVLVDQILNWAPAAFIVSLFLCIWLNLFFTLRNALIWRPLVSYAYGARDLLEFRVPDFFIWPFLLALTLVVGEGHLWNEGVGIIGGNILYILGVFYFFQGMGLVVDFLSFLKIGGFIRSFLLIFMVFMAWKLIAVVGVVDMWFDFRKRMQNKKEGDLS